MLLLSRPSDAQIRAFLVRQQSAPHSYPDVGASAGVPPPGYAVDHNRIRLGEGAAAFKRAVEAVRRWEMFHLNWVWVHWPETPIEAGATVAITSQQLGFWTLNASRIVYTIDEDGPVRRFGFAYGTLPDHVESGEERFVVEWRREDDSVWYDLLAFSRPNHVLVTCGYRVGRALQRRFARDSLRAMSQFVSAGVRR